MSAPVDLPSDTKAQVTAAMRTKIGAPDVGDAGPDRAVAALAAAA